MFETRTRPLTVQDYRELPPDDWRYQLIEGEIVNMTPAPSVFHQEISAAICGTLWRYLADHDLGHVMAAPLDVYLTETNVFQPDLLFICNGHESIIAADGVHGAPDWVVEILSPRSSRFDLGPKRSVYARAGVEEIFRRR